MPLYLKENLETNVLNTLLNMNDIAKQTKKIGRPRKKDNSIIIFTKKSVGAVHMSNDLSLFERKIMNILIKHAQEIEKYQTPEGIFTDEKGNRFWKINFEMVEEMLNIDKYHQRKDISEALDRLVETSLKFNILKKDNTTTNWNVKTSLLAEVRYKDTSNNKFLNEIYYYFSPTIKEALINPKLYAPITLNVQKEFKSKHSLALWEYLNSELSVRSTDTCETRPIPINDYVYLVAGSNVEYKKFFETNRNLIKKPLEEVNAKSDLTAEAITHKKGRKVVAISHNIARKEKFKSPLFDVNVNTVLKHNLEQEEALNNTILTESIKVQTEQPKNDKINEILIKERISEIKRKEFVLKYSDNHILENIEEAKNFAIKRKTEVSAPLIIKAIEENWANSGPEKEKMKEKQDLIWKLRTLIYSYDRVDKRALPAPSKYIAQNIYFYKLFQNKEFAEEYKARYIKEENKEVAFQNQFQGCKEYLTNQFKEMDFIISDLKNNHNYDFTEFLNDNNLTETKLYNAMELSKEEFLKIKQEVL